MKQNIITLLLVLATLTSFAQTQTSGFGNEYGLQYGVSFKTTIDFPLKKGQQMPAVRLSAVGGVAAPFAADFLYPSFHTELQVYNSGIGSRYDRGFKKPTLDLITALTLTGGVKNNLMLPRVNRFPQRFVPLYYFADFVQPALQNPYSYSLSLGTNAVFTTDKYRKFQRVGFLNVQGKALQLSYYNDGGPFIAKAGLGGPYDRYYTGGGVISYSNDRVGYLNHFEASYHKFTGYTQHAYELASQLNLFFVDYRDAEQNDYNRSLLSFRLSGKDGIGAGVKFYNYLKSDFQHLIHWKGNSAYHLVNKPAYTAISGTYFYNNNQQGRK